MNNENNAHLFLTMSPFGLSLRPLWTSFRTTALTSFSFRLFARSRRISFSPVVRHTSHMSFGSSNSFVVLYSTVLFSIGVQRFIIQSSTYSVSFLYLSNRLCHLEVILKCVRLGVRCSFGLAEVLLAISSNCGNISDRRPKGWRHRRHI
jgi:hypothetical protein